MPEQSVATDSGALDEALAEAWTCLRAIQECIELALTGTAKETDPRVTEAAAASERIRELRNLHEQEAHVSSRWRLWRAIRNCTGIWANCMAGLTKTPISEDDRATLIEILKEERLKITSVQLWLVNERTSLLAAALKASGVLAKR